MGLKMVFIIKPVTIDLFIFVEKYRKNTLYITSKYQASRRKRILGFDKKENCDIEKLLSFI